MKNQDRIKDLKYDLRNISNTLDDISATVDDIQGELRNLNDDSIDCAASVIEAATFGLVTIEAKYGASSKEAKDVRDFLSEAQA